MVPFFPHDPNETFIDLEQALRQDQHHKNVRIICQRLRRTLAQMDALGAERSKQTVQEMARNERLKDAVEATLSVVQRLHARYHGFASRA